MALTLTPAQIAAAAAIERAERSKGTFGIYCSDAANGSTLKPLAVRGTLFDGSPFLLDLTSREQIVWLRDHISSPVDASGRLQALSMEEERARPGGNGTYRRGTRIAISLDLGTTVLTGWLNERAAFAVAVASGTCYAPVSERIDAATGRVAAKVTSIQDLIAASAASAASKAPSTDPMVADVEDELPV